jgi:hypothetical protein
MAHQDQVLLDSLQNKYDFYLNGLAKLNNDLVFLNEDMIDSISLKINLIKKILDSAEKVIAMNDIKKQIQEKLLNIIKDKYNNVQTKHILIEFIKQCIDTIMIKKELGRDNEYLDYNYKIFNKINISLKYRNSNRDSDTNLQYNYTEIKKWDKKNTKNIKDQIKKDLDLYFKSDKSKLKGIYKDHEKQTIDDVYDFIQEVQQCIMVMENARKFNYLN